MKYLFSLLLLLSFTAIRAQTSFGVLSGYNRSQTQYDVEVPEDAHTHIHSWHVSGWMTVPLGNRIKLNTELGFIQRGAACMPGWVDFNQDSELRLQYGQLAVNTSYDLIRWKRLTIAAYLGAGGAYLLSANETVLDSWNDWEIRRELDLDDGNSQLNRLDLGAHYGGVISFRAGCGQLLTRIGGYRGFVHVNEDNFSLSRDWVVSLGYAQSF